MIRSSRQHAVQHVQQRPKRATSGGGASAAAGARDRRRRASPTRPSSAAAGSARASAASVAAASPCSADLGGPAAPSCAASMSMRTRPCSSSGSLSPHSSRSESCAPDQQRRVGVAQQVRDRREAQRRSQAQRIRVGHRAAGVDRQADRRGERARDRERLRPGVGAPPPSNTSGRRAPASSDAARATPARVGDRRRRRPAGPAGERRPALDHVERQRDVDRARPAGPEHLARPVDDLRQLVGIRDGVAEGGDRSTAAPADRGGRGSRRGRAAPAGTAPETTSIGIESW